MTLALSAQPDLQARRVSLVRQVQRVRLVLRVRRAFKVSWVRQARRGLPERLVTLDLLALLAPPLPWPDPPVPRARPALSALV